MNLIHKLALVALCTCAAGLNAQNETCQTQDMAQTFTLSAFANMKSDKQEEIITDLIQKSGLSDEKIAQLLEVEPAAVTRVRTYFGPREVYKLARLAADGYKNRCYKRTIIDCFVVPLLGVTATTVCCGGWALWSLEKERNERLSSDIKYLQERVKYWQTPPKKWFWQRS